MESRVARKESYRDHKGALRELGARDEEKTDRVASLGIRTC